MVLLDRAVLRVLPVQDQYHQCGQQSRHQQRSRSSPGGWRRGRSRGSRTPDPASRCVEGRVCHRVPRTGNARHAGIRVALLPRTGPSQRAARRRPAGRGGRVRRRDVVGPLLAVERTPGALGVRLVVAGCGAAGHVAALRRRERPRAALPPGDHRPGHRHAHRDVPGPVLGGPGQRRGQQRAHHRRRLAAQGRAQRPPARVRRHHPRPAARRGGQPRRAGPRRPRDGLQQAGRPATAHRRRGQRSHGRVVRGVGRRADHRERAGRDAAPDDRRLPRRGRSRRPGAAGAPRAGRRTSARPRRWRTTSGAATSSRPRSAGTSTSRRRSTRSARTSRSSGSSSSSTSRPTSACTPPGSPSTPSWASTRSCLHHVGQEQEAFVAAFGEKVLPQLRSISGGPSA